MLRISKRSGDAYRLRAGMAATALSMLLAACIFAPGKFASQLDVRKDHSFSFHYAGEILMLPLMKNNKQETFTPEACHEEDSDNERECTPAEIANQKTEWEKQRAATKKSDAEAAQMLMGGIDPNNPESGNELAAKLRRQVGWNKAEYLGDGKFDVDFAFSGRLDRDFVFPTMEGFPMSNAFVQVSLRQDGTVRIDAPGFGPSGGGQTMSGMMSGVSSSGDADKSPVALADGIFAVTTNGEVLANNTDEGTKSGPGGQSLMWKITPSIKAEPTALLRLAR